MPKLIKDLIKSTIISLLLLLLSLSICSFVLTKYDFDINNYKYISFMIFALISAILGFVFKDNEKFGLLIIPPVILSLIPAVAFKSISINILINIIIILVSYLFIIFIIKSSDKRKKKDINSIRRSYAKKRKK